MSTNPIEGMFSLVRSSERNIKRSRGSTMLHQWFGMVFPTGSGSSSAYQALLG